MKKLGLCFLATLMVITLVGCSQKKLLKVKQNEFTIELGESLSKDLDTYLDVSGLTDAEIEKIKATELKLDIPAENEVQKDERSFVKTGTYNASVTLGKEIVEFKIIVADTIAPILTGLESIQLTKGQEFAYRDHYNATDLNDLDEMQFDTSAIDINTAGEYILIVSINDKAGNTAKKEVPITVMAVGENQESVSEIIATEDGKQSYVTTVTDKPVEVVEAPSNNIATNNTQSPSNNEGNMATTTPPANDSSSDRTDSICVPAAAGNSNQIFNNEDDLIAYGEAYMDQHYREVNGYAGASIGCGKWTINFY